MSVYANAVVKSTNHTLDFLQYMLYMDCGAACNRNPVVSFEIAQSSKYFVYSQKTVESILSLVLVSLHAVCFQSEKYPGSICC